MIVEILPYALAVALSPMPIVGLLLILLSKRPYVNSVLYALGWVVGIAFLVLVVSYFLGSKTTDSGQSSTSVSMVLHMLIGIVLVAFAVRTWMGRGKKGKPAWMRAVESFTPFKAFGLGFVFAVVNVKNTPVGIAVAAVLASYDSLSLMVEGFVFYLIIAGSTVIVPVVLYLVFGARLKGVFKSLNMWLVTHNSVILSVLFLVLGIWMIMKALE